MHAPHAAPHDPPGPRATLWELCAYGAATDMFFWCFGGVLARLDQPWPTLSWGQKIRYRMLRALFAVLDVMDLMSETLNACLAWLFVTHAFVWQVGVKIVWGLGLVGLWWVHPVLGGLAVGGTLLLFVKARKLQAFGAESRHTLARWGLLPPLPPPPPTQQGARRATPDEINHLRARD